MSDITGTLTDLLIYVKLACSNHESEAEADGIPFAFELVLLFVS